MKQSRLSFRRSRDIGRTVSGTAEGPGCTRAHVLHNNADVFCVCPLERL